MAVQRINQAIQELDLAEVERYLNEPTRHDDDPGFEVCQVKKDDWDQYVLSEDQAFCSRAMVWFNGRIYIAEMLGRVHESTISFFQLEMTRATRGYRYLVPAGAVYAEQQKLIEPDIGIGPTHASGAVLPAGLEWGEFHTLKVEVGVLQRWPQLNARAERWSRFPGVQYALCIHISPDTNRRTYRVFSVTNEAIEQPEMRVTDIVDPTPVSFNSHRLLGLPPNAPLPPGFPDPVVTVNLWSVVDGLLF